MKIINIIDSLELNGGSTMFLEMTAGMQKYWPDDEVSAYVVSKTGEFGREGLVSSSFALSYGVDLEVYSYEVFEQKILPKIRKSVVFHHVLGYTKSMIFHKSCKYIVINHTTTNVKRLPSFNSRRLVCVSGYFAKKVKEANSAPHRRVCPYIVLNGCEDYFDVEPEINDNRLVVGRCQRIVPTKFRKEKIAMDNVVEYIIGPIKDEAVGLLPKGAKLFGPIFDRWEKIPIIRSFDVYLHGAPRPEGCSMAVLEAFSCGVPVIARKVGGGIQEVIRHGENGFFYKKTSELRRILRDLSNPSYLAKIKRNAREHFLSRFHVKIMLNNYRNFMK